MGEEWAATVVMLGLALVIGATVVLRGPVGKAVAQWISGWSHTEAKWIEAHAPGAGAAAGAVDQLRAEVEELRRQLAEVQERLDFAERLLAQRRDAERLAPPR